ncbi:hypothetical protein X560_0885 [Listeria fleischmannii 1991]|uniref:Protein of uncharacterized function C-terminal (DUF3324) n=2 Tax=Listeria fleischmannii TaxID=1069827 RepID=A0A2X3HDI8_9LIST|nr:DUF916 and DUF3324 domain-containing protein [Listeria fleischmannii]EMG27148.1 cell surface protein [Listeria fleischmannii subsp. fleischmannii LU2006-1]KMT60273.1 hypothetical protein X560_0885 [Listeria fleischmannii 1991]SQC70391.1 Protein of uncharacterised function C-terminal (DUF3324) [Listeria fleischmannii subsp. fleischmannii]
MKHIKLLIILLIGFIFTVSYSLTSQAAEFNFGVKTVIPDNQIDKGKTYFNLLVKPGQQQELKIQLNNDTDKDVIVSNSIHTATTNINGVVDYGKGKNNTNIDLSNRMEDIVDLPAEITIPKHGKTELTLKLNIPEKKFEGMLAGGITIEEKVNETKKAKTNGVQNRYAYTIGLLLQENEKLDIKDNPKLGEVKPSQVNNRNVILTDIQNALPKYMNHVAVSANITGEGKSKSVYSYEKKKMQIAPNSHFYFPVPLMGEKLKSGDYTLHLKLTSDEGKWDLTKNFKIKSDVAKAYNKKDKSIKEDSNYMNYILIGIGVLLVVIGTIIIFQLRKRKEGK